MKRSSFFLIAALLMLGIPAMLSGHTVDVSAEGSAMAVSSSLLAEFPELSQLEAPACAYGNLQQSFGFGSTVLDSLRTNIIICDTRTCECFDCQWGGPCVPVPPPSWCVAP